MDGHTPQEFRIRPVEAAHIGDLIRLGDAAKLSPWTANNYLDEMKNPDAVMLRLVSNENATIGFIVGRLVTGGLIEVSQDAEIYNIMIDDPYRGCGLAQPLLDRFLKMCSERE